MICKYENGFITIYPQEIFPELAESEDERIRKEMIFYFTEEIPQCSIQEHADKMKEFIAWLEKQGKEEYALKSFKHEDVYKFMQYIEKEAKAYEFNLPNRCYDIYAFAKDILAWLEKQGQSTFDKCCQEGDRIVENPDGTHFNISQLERVAKVEPKFHEGEWVVDDCGYVWKIELILNQFYVLEGVEGDLSQPTIEWVDETFHLWTIQDAKDGDILMANAPFIFNGNLEGGIGCPGAHCAINTLGKFQIPKSPRHWTGHTTTPATKEQREFLFKKMKEAGYEWDAEKKDLREIERKITESEGKKIRKAIIKFLIDVNNGAYTKSELEIASWIAWLEKQGEQMKTPEESLDISSDKWNDIVDRCLFD